MGNRFGVGRGSRWQDVMGRSSETSDGGDRERIEEREIGVRNENGGIGIGIGLKREKCVVSMKSKS